MLLLRKYILAFAGVVQLLFFSTAVSQSAPIWQMQHSSWRGHDGAPQGVDALGQAADGTIWLASSGHLTQFDGIHFSQYQVPPELSNDPSGIRISQMLSDRAGALWMFRAFGAPLVLRNGKLSASKVFNDPRTGGTWEAFMDIEGRLFALQDDARIVELSSDDTWVETKRFPRVQGFLSDAAIDSEGTLWIVRDQMLLRFRTGDLRGVDLGFPVGFDSQIIPLADHTLWVMSRSAPAVIHGQRVSSLRHIDEAGHLVSPALTVDGIDMILVANNGELWVTAQNRGTWKLPALARVRIQGGEDRPRALNASDDFVSAAAGPLMQAADGSIWIAGNLGLDSFRPARLVPALREMHSGMWALCANGTSGVWIADDVGTLVHIDQAGTHQLTGYKSRGLGAFFACGSDGRVWLAAGAEVLELRGSSIRKLPPLPGTEGGFVDFGGATYAGGRLTVVAIVGAKSQEQLWTWTGEQWIRELPELKLRKVAGLYRDESGALYLSFNDGALRTSTTEGLRDIPLPGPAKNILYGFTRTSYGLIGFGRQGICLIDSDSGVYLNISSQDVYETTGVVESTTGDLWLTGSNGIIDLPAVDVKRLLKDRYSRINGLRVAEGDFLGPDDAIYDRSAAWRDATGRLWFGTLQGVVSLDPKSVFAAVAQPKLSIRSVTSLNAEMDGERRFPPGTTDVTVRYHGLLLSAPRSVSYRYRLLGAENGWHEAGDGTEATYAHLRPGLYTFQVMASAGNNVWSMPVQDKPFRILPRFWQTWWFLSLFVITVSALAMLLFKQRVRVANGRARLLANERAEERTRIAREIHDTLLQGIQGLLLNFATVRQRLVQGDEVLPLLDRSLSATEALVVEGRERIAAIRLDATSTDDLYSRLRDLGNRQQEESGVPVRVALFGRGRELSSTVTEELYFITREALRNACLHASPTQVHITLHFKRGLLRLECRDDGTGFDAAAATQSAALRQKWGLNGMRERAAAIHADLRIVSDAGKGTRVVVRMDARHAYRRKIADGTLE